MVKKKPYKKDKQRSTKHTYKTKDRVTRTPLKHLPCESYCCLFDEYCMPSLCEINYNQLFIKKNLLIFITHELENFHQKNLKYWVWVNPWVNHQMLLKQLKQTGYSGNTADDKQKQLRRLCERISKNSTFSVHEFKRFYLPFTCSLCFCMQRESD